MARPTIAVPNDIPIRASFAEVITPSDSDTFHGTVGVYIGGTGNLAVTMEGDNGIVIFSAIPTGTFLPLRITQIRSTSTTATAIVGLW